MEEEMVNISMPRATFDIAKEFVSALGQALAAADAKIKADLKGAKADEAMSSVLGGSPSEAALGGFGDELSAASNRGLGL